MKMSKRLVAWVVTVALVTAAVVKTGRTAGPLEQRSMQGIRGVYVTVFTQTNPKIKEPLSSEYILAQVEAGLHKNGIRTLSRREWELEPGRPHLVVNAGFDGVSMNNDPLRPTGFSYCIRFDLTQDCTLTRNRGVTVPAVTANQIRWGTGDNTGWLMKELQGTLDSFVADFKSQNP